MRITFYNPPVFYYGDMWFKMLPTMALPILTRVFNDSGHKAEAVDLEALQVTPAKLAAAWSKQRDNWPDVVGITGLHQAEQGLRETIQALRGVGYTGKIVVGGAYATTHPERPLAWGADLVITGECEANVVQLIESGATGIHEGIGPDIKDVPIPDWDNWYPSISSYYGNMGLLRPNPGISMWTRGCPYKCIFCSNSIFYHQATRYRDPAKIEKEMRYLWALGCKNIYVYDDEMVGTKVPDGWMKEIADRIEDLAQAGLRWVTQGRCSRHHITLELLQDAKRAGCRAIFYGLESFSPKVLKAIKKVLTIEDIWHTLTLSREAGIENGVFTMVGNYKETAADVELTVAGLKEAYSRGLIQYRQTTVATIMPGTQLETIAKSEGWYIEPPNKGRDLHTNPMGTPWLSAWEIKHYQQKIHEACPVLIP